ncbi:ankyrin repeat domain-containing protein [Photobacterium profundum]|uniref:AnkB protein n=1 Tax=Photobacterium profundum 3TCK TaxID=314280 RepID=Q1ZAT4_9GAMM|nr:ankyrin repeat domain-containing protein [Photobacterium profundum]EAS45408.1 AnkB protein [Photobacterium profundum 3TCK]PSV63406.1 ankyrin repeat domain-containing protein [Photobacterium profundum]
MKKIFIALAFVLLSTTTSAMNVKINENSEYQELVNYFFAAARVGDIEVLDRFLSAGFPINQRNNQTYTALMVASYSGQKEATQLLLDNSANVCLQDKRGNTAVMGALVKGELSIVRMLYNTPCSKNLKNAAGQTLEAFADMFGKGDFINQLKNNTVD